MSTHQSWSILDQIHREIGTPAPDPLESESYQPLPPRAPKFARQPRRPYARPVNRSGYRSPQGQPLPGEIPLKEWLVIEGRARNFHPRSIYRFFQKGHYRHLKLRRVNARIIFVTPN